MLELQDETKVIQKSKEALFPRFAFCLLGSYSLSVLPHVFFSSCFLFYFTWTYFLLEFGVLNTSFLATLFISR